MKRTYIFIALAVLVSAIAWSGKIYNSAVDAALCCDTVQTLEVNGYDMGACKEYPNIYHVVPQGEYDWGYVEMTFLREPGGVAAEYEPPLRVTVRCYIVGHNKKGVMTYEVSSTHIE